MPMRIALEAVLVHEARRKKSSFFSNARKIFDEVTDGSLG